MPQHSGGEILCHLRRLVQPENLDNASDGALLDRFAALRDEAAFAALVRRHGPLVLGVCRRVLGNPHDAEDAFQATFLVLQRRSAGLEARATIANWLYSVAYHVALRARARAARQRQQERAGAALSRPPSCGSSAELREVIDAELTRLPEKYRAPVVLCYLEGKSNEEAAQLLGWTLRSLTGRLARARQVLHNRLARRSLAFSTGLLAATVVQQPVPAALVDTTVKTASLCAAGEAAAGMVPHSVTTLAEGALNAMWMSQVKLMATLAAVLAVLTGSGLLLHQALAEPVPPAIVAQAAPERADVVADLPSLPASFTRVHDLVKPQATDSQFASVPWAETIWEARVKAAAEGKPIFIWVTGGPPGMC